MNVIRALQWNTFVPCLAALNVEKDGRGVPVKIVESFMPLMPTARDSLADDDL